MATLVRYRVIAATTAIAVVMYLDRVCIAEIAKEEAFKSELQLTETQAGMMLSAFFFAYALAQVPAGWISDRLGVRKMLPMYVLIWSLCTMLTGLATGFAMLLVARLLFGVAQAGCYPTASSVVKKWIPLRARGRASGIVSVGGRLGATIAPLVTAWLLKDYLSWRQVLVCYGLFGIIIALNFWWLYRESPEQHPSCDLDEVRLIQGETVEEIDKQWAADFPPILPLVRSGTMWLMGLLQFGINLGWVFLITWLPTYLQDVKQMDSKTGGLMSSVVLFAGIVGMLLGGPLTDFAAMRLGKRWGRSLPLVVCYAIAIAAYLSCLRLENPWAFIAAASVVAFATDLSVPSIWAYMQDVGGENTAAVFGWGNMWGNFGAATTPILLPLILKHFDQNGDWHEAFLLFAGGYVAAGIAAFGINANKQIASSSTIQTATKGSLE